MVVHDNPDVLRAVDHVLRVHGYDLLTARTAAEALAKMSQQPHLVILDSPLPDMTAPQLCRRLRNAEATVDLPVIILAARHQVPPAADAYVLKPIDAHSLLACVAELINQSSAAISALANVKNTSSAAQF